VGGDTAVWDGRLVVVVSALGKLPRGGRAVRRSGAKVGDTLFVSGALGGSILGRHLTFEPRIKLALELARAAGEGLHAMMDLSDGLAADLPRMCTASGVGAEVHAGRLPLHEDAWKLAEKDGLPAGLHGLVDGEDYELLFAMDPEAVPSIVGVGERLGVAVTAVGTVVEAGKGLSLVDGVARRLQWPRGGWEHGATGGGWPDGKSTHK
jgi:thiamine-monophosphate kinase